MYLKTERLLIMSDLKKILSPSILSADFKKLGEELETIDKAGAEYVHVDVMDGLFVKSISFGMPVIKSARSATDKVFDVHLMIEEPIRYIEDFVKAGADIITVHVEACKDVVATLEKIKECGVKAAITLNPPTPVSAIEPYLDKVDMVLVVSSDYSEGTSVPEGTTVTITVSHKQEEVKKTVTMINLVGKTEQEAIKWIKDNGLNYTTKNDTTVSEDKVGLVTACDKSSGSTVNEGTTITITVGAKSDAAQN
jgi:ribulose-phosphate 3-epimerase